MKATRLVVAVSAMAILCGGPASAQSPVRQAPAFAEVTTAKQGGLKGSRPNIIFVMTDDQGMNLSYMGHPYLRTPHIDAHLPGNRGFSEVLMHGAGGIGQRERGKAVTSCADFPPNQGLRDKAAYFNPVLLHNDTVVQTRGYSGKGTPYEGGVHVPAFWQWQGILPEGRDVTALTAHIDLYKTVCELAGVDHQKAKHTLDGRSLLPLLENPTAAWEPRTLYTHRGNLGKNPIGAIDKMWSVRTDRWRLVGNELFDIRSDPLEGTDVAAQFPEVVETLRKAHHEWYRQMIPFMINQNNTWEGAAPFEARYERQRTERGIPDWMPADL